MKSNHENNIRLFLKRLRARLREQDAAARWPVEEGWQQLKGRIAAEEGEMGGERVLMGPGVGEDGLTGEIGVEEEPAQKTRIFSLKYGYAAAVILVLLLGGGYWFLHGRQDRSNIHPQVAGTSGGEKAILPPTNVVQLVLSDGRKIAVNKTQTLTEQGGVAIQTDSGSVNYQQAPGVKAGEMVFNTLEVPRGNKTRIILPDGTKVWINASSRLKYPTVFEGDRREVELEGEAYFEVTKDLAHPFVVHAKGMDIGVLGTAFNVNTYDPLFATTLVSGKVSVKGNAADLILEPGDQARLNQMSGESNKSKVNVSDFTAWKDDDLYIGNLSFDKVAVMLGRQFDYDIELSDPALERLHFTIDMPSPKSLQEVLDHICSTTEGIRFSISGRKVTLSRSE